VEETFKLDTVGKWVKYDALLFKKLDREWSLSDFRPFLDEGPSERQEALALLQKGVILFQQKSTTEQHARSRTIAVTFATALPTLLS
jgi:hypothetical protein